MGRKTSSGWKTLISFLNVVIVIPLFRRGAVVEQLVEIDDISRKILYLVDSLGPSPWLHDEGKGWPALTIVLLCRSRCSPNYRKEQAPLAIFDIG